MALFTMVPISAASLSPPSLVDSSAFFLLIWLRMSTSWRPLSPASPTPRFLLAAPRKALRTSFSSYFNLTTDSFVLSAASFTPPISFCASRLDFESPTILSTSLLNEASCFASRIFGGFFALPMEDTASAVFFA